ncbi:unnamed protein product [Cylicocyclus nassatus]|uniref:AN1-type domain-containing protein n=1 Tax=Cylicocyclus nassatus TaxID=53992 RepID=A0AA36M4L0_CYLNA|nr:unnamed protein product [Cylicocyclus nassatus]
MKLFAILASVRKAALLLFRNVSYSLEKNLELAVQNVLDPTLKSLLDSASAQLYYNCANNYDYEKLCEAFSLPDYMSTWYKLTLMHCWMVLTRMHTSLDAYAYLRLQRSMLATLWLDVDNRLKIVSEEVKLTLTNRSDLKKMHGLHLQTFLEYDEGFLADDRMFAAAIWRCLYMSRSFDPIHVLKVIAYMRSTMAWLDTLDLNEILVDGIKEWKQVKPKEAEETSFHSNLHMAELPDLGARCEFHDCKQLDFLPFTCPICKCCFCSDHRFAHGCNNSKEYDLATAVPSSSGPIREFLCSFAGCSRAESIKIVCPHCERNYCLKHRHADEHLCDAMPEKLEKPRPQVTLPIPEPSKVEKPPKTTKTASLNPADQKKMDKILIMKLKMNAKATADVPAEERMFLFVEGKDVNGGRQAVVVSKKWTVGRCAAAIQKLLSLQTSKALQLHTSSGQLLDYAETVSGYLADMDTVTITKPDT